VPEDPSECDSSSDTGVVLTTGSGTLSDDEGDGAGGSSDELIDEDDGSGPSVVGEDSAATVGKGGVEIGGVFGLGANFACPVT
jgi:hypothetical protein